MKLYNGGLIITGLVIFLGFVTLPVWANLGKPAYVPQKLTMPAAPNDKACVEDKEVMRNTHMQILDHWRDAVVRDGNRVYVNSHGKKFAISLQNTCMKCHNNKEEFCDKCHAEASVSPYCWDCHIAPKGKKQ